MQKIINKFSKNSWIVILIFSIFISFNQTINVFGLSQTISFYFGVLIISLGLFLCLVRQVEINYFNLLIYALSAAPIILGTLIHWDFAATNSQIFLFNLFWSFLMTMLVRNTEQLFIIINTYLFALFLLLFSAYIFNDF